jgi:Ca2+-binding RTX toxin-like protein
MVGDGSDDLWGDVHRGTGSLTGGDDTLIGGAGNDELVGDHHEGVGLLTGGDGVLDG